MEQPARVGRPRTHPPPARAPDEAAPDEGVLVARFADTIISWAAGALCITRQQYRIDGGVRLHSAGALRWAGYSFTNPLALGGFT